MISAKRANVLASRVKMLEDLSDQIKELAKSGVFSISYSGLTEEMKEALMEEGYVVVEKGVDLHKVKWGTNGKA